MPRPIASTLALGAAGGAWALRQLERDGLVIRAIHPEVPPRVEYRLTPLGRGLGKVVCGFGAGRPGTWVTAAGAPGVRRGGPTG
jgi:hypothetical protein